jgi:hypothetical protein
VCWLALVHLCFWLPCCRCFEHDSHWNCL